MKINTVSQVERSWIYVFKLEERWIGSDEILYCRPVEKCVGPFRLSCHVTSIVNESKTQIIRLQRQCIVTRNPPSHF